MRQAWRWGCSRVMLALFVGCWMSAPAVAGEYSNRAEWTQAADGITALQVETPAGNIEVTPGPAGQIRVEVTKRVRAMDAAGARGLFDQIKVDRRREGARYLLTASWIPEERTNIDGSPSVSFRIEAPRGMMLTARCGAGNVDAAGIGEGRLTTGAGNLTARDLHGPLTLHTGSGNISVDHCTGAVQADSGAGNIGTSHTGKTDLRTGVGNLTVQSVTGDLVAHTAVGSVQVDGVTGEANATSSVGKVEVHR